MAFQLTSKLARSSIIHVSHHSKPSVAKVNSVRHSLPSTALRNSRWMSIASLSLADGLPCRNEPKVFSHSQSTSINKTIRRFYIMTARPSTCQAYGSIYIGVRQSSPSTIRLLSHAASQQLAGPQSSAVTNAAEDATKAATATTSTTSSTVNKTAVPNILTKIKPRTVKERKENIYTVPNILTFSRLIAAPAIGYAILTSHPHLALGLFAYAGITDLIDGYLARRFNSQTVVGTIIDPMADKILMTTVVVCLTVQGILPIWLAVIILGRDVALAISAIYFRWISLPPPKTFSRYWDFSLPSAEVHPTEISKINTLLQLLLVGNAMVLPALPVAVVEAWNLYGVFEGWQYLVATTTVWSGMSYVFSKDAVKILSVQEVKEKEMQQQQQQQQQQQDQQKE